MQTTGASSRHHNTFATAGNAGDASRVSAPVSVLRWVNLPENVGVVFKCRATRFANVQQQVRPIVMIGIIRINYWPK